MKTSKLSTKAVGSLIAGLLLVTPMAFPKHEAQATFKAKTCIDTETMTWIECLPSWGTVSDGLDRTATGGSK